MINRRSLLTSRGPEAVVVGKTAFQESTPSRSGFAGSLSQNATYRQLAVGRMVRSAVMQPDERFACPCCGQLTLNEPAPGTWLICDVCEWEDDPVQYADFDYVGGANRVSLRQARDFYRSLGISSPERLQRKQLRNPGRLPQ